VGTGGLRLPQNFRLLLRDPADVEILAAAPWWNPRHAALALAGLAGVVGLCLAWVTALRRRVQAQAALLWHRVKTEAELKERHRLARELHDTLEQDLAGIGLCLDAAAQSLPEAPAIAAQHVSLAREQLSAGLEDVRYSIWALRDQALDQGSLAAALEEIGRELALCGGDGLEVGVSVEGTSYPLPLEMENDLLRIGQEAITNAVKHGRAARIAIGLRYEPGAFQLHVIDDGRGFDAKSQPPRGHFGLLGMHERAQAMGATLEVQSALNRGTRVAVSVPVTRRTLSQAG
jgi:signal transduction histidine kinase